MTVTAVEQSQPAAGGPIFVVGAMGSGTTLMRLILDSHEHIAIAQETGFMRAVLANKWIPFWKFGGEWYGRLGLSEDDLDAQLRDFYGGLFGRFAQQQGKRRWGDKTPYHTWHTREAARVFPDAVFVGTVRHPGAVASSLHNRFRYDWPKSVGHWLRSNTELVHRAGDLGRRFALCRYEDLVLEPEATIRELLAWLGEPWSSQVLEHHLVHGQRGTLAKVEGRTRSTDPIDASRIATWSEGMDDEGYWQLRRRAAPLGAFFGYDID
ncbi:MAG: sulfotransferase family protein, partial [Egibacteraceae bacterium]